jgi:S-adenosylmethionine:tRNA ribosyltransferase-isomerase
VRVSGDAIEHRRVRDLPDYLDADDLLVFNDTAVTPARIFARRESGGRVEGLVLDTDDDGTWHLMLRPSRRLRPGDRLDLLGPDDVPGDNALVLADQDRTPGGGVWTARLDPPAPASAVLDAIGRTPLPPYIVRARVDRALCVDDAQDRAWYQTVYADLERRGSVAAPTAGLHFTPDLLAAIDARGVRRATVTLHVGPGTFRPVDAETLEGHRMHHEHYEVPATTVAALRSQREGGRRIVAVGTTSVRTLESLPHPLPGDDTPIAGVTDLLIAPPYEFRLVDAMLTNFHLPRSTLLALVAARLGLERMRAVYAEAVDRRYRFYSYGDAMLILP